jgi:predicted O-methyltransferase YrrM
MASTIRSKRDWCEEAVVMQVLEIPILKRMIESGIVEDDAGKSHALTSAVDINYAQVLHDQVVREKPEVVVEVGFANGVSTLSILSALEKNGGNGRLISIDPYQTEHWHGVGVANVRRAGFAARHQLIEIADYLALPTMVAESSRVDFAYIDGAHTFDNVFLDFFYLDKMLSPGHLMGFNDCIYPAIHRVLRYLRSNRHYDEVDVGLPKDFSGKFGIVSRLVRRLEDRTPADRYFRKVEDLTPPWDFYKRF